MEIDILTASAEEINFAPSTEIEEITQNVRTIIEKRRNTPSFSYGDISRNMVSV